MDYKNAGVDIEAGYKSVELMKEHVKRTMRAEVSRRTWRIFRSLFSGKDQGDGRTGIVIRYRRMRNKGKTCHLSWTSMIPLVLMQLPCVSMILPVQVENRYSSWIILHVARTIRRRSQRS